MQPNNEDLKARVEERARNEQERRKDRERRIQEERKSKASKAGFVEANEIEELSDSEIQGYLNENKWGDAKLFSRLFRDKFIFVVNREEWLFWAGHHWLEDVFNQRYQAIEKIWKIYLDYADKKQNEANEETDKQLKYTLQKVADAAYQRVKNLTDTNGQERLLEMCKRIPNPLLAKAEQFDTKHWLKACPNGVIDLRDGKLHPGRPHDYLLKSIPIEYDETLFTSEHPCPEASKFLLSSLDNSEVVEFIWRLLGYGMITKRDEHVFVIFWGEYGRNGKDTLIKLVTHVLGEELSGDVDISMFLQTSNQRSSSASSPDILDLKGMCLAWLNEADEGQRFAHSKLKKLTGGGYISARGNYDKKITRWKQTHLPIMTTNRLPKANPDDAPFWARALIVKWPYSFMLEPDPDKPHEKQAIKDLDNILVEEAKGVLARMVRGAVDYFRDGLHPPEQIKKWTQEQRLNFDDIAHFLEEWCICEPYQENDNAYKTRISAADIYDAFCLWYAANRVKRYSISSRKFGEMLNKKNIPLKRSNGSWRLGISLTAEASDELENSRQKKF